MHPHDEEDVTELTQQRSKNLSLRRLLRKEQQAHGETFAAFCEAGQAQGAVFAIWAATGLSCDPQDYDQIIDYAAKAIAAYQSDPLVEA